MVQIQVGGFQGSAKNGFVRAGVCIQKLVETYYLVSAISWLHLIKP
jgi:hypothetical protein